MIALRSRYIIPPLLLFLATLTLLFVRLPHSSEKPQLKQHPIYKPPKPPQPPEIPEYFPLAASAKSYHDLPPVPSWNRPPIEHVPEQTRLYIGFTRYWPLLQQVVLSYIVAGWPPSDIYVIENTGTFDANKNKNLSPSNPFYMDYERLTNIFGVNVITTPSLQSFAQLQNMYLSEAINNNLSYYFWGHMDVVAQTHEDAIPYKSFYERAVDVIRESTAPGYEKDEETGKDGRWAIRFFSYDWLALVNVKAFIEVGGWDSMISYYGTDCDMHSRLTMNGLRMPIADAGQIFDVSRSLDDLEVLFRRKKKSGESYQLSRGNAERRDTHNSTITQPSIGANGPNAQYFAETEEDTLASPGWKQLQIDLEAMAEEKRTDPYRNSWQLKQRGGDGEPYHVDVDGWEKALQMTINAGVKIYEEKWGHQGCDIKDLGLKEGDQWRVEHDW